MITILSPAKSLDYESVRELPASTKPRLMDSTNFLVSRAASLSKEEIGKLMHISEQLAELNFDRYQNFATLPERPAIQAFNGDVYDGLAIEKLTNDDIIYAQKHLRMLSGLYGMLRPLDDMKPYRLEMGTKRFPEDKKLSIWWDKKIADLISQDIEESGNKTLLNLASQEYYASIKGRLPKDIRVVDVEFIAADGRMITFHAKTARGVMARWMVVNRVNEIEDMKAFNSAGYSFDAEASTENQWIFRRSPEEDGPPY